MRIMQVALIVGGLIASALFTGGTAVAGPVGGETKPNCYVIADKGHPAQIVDDHNYPLGEFGQAVLTEGTVVKSSCNTTTSPSGEFVRCGDRGDELVQLLEGRYASFYVPLTCVTHLH